MRRPACAGNAKLLRAIYCADAQDRKGEIILLTAERIHPWRKELAALLAAAPVSRPPALRRSLHPEFLFATDLPACAGPESCEIFLRCAADAGWESFQESGWMNLRKKDVLFPPDWWDSLPQEEEAVCLRVLTAVHPSLRFSRLQSCMLQKAREEGPDSLEKACRTVHRDFARQLREQSRQAGSAI